MESKPEYITEAMELLNGVPMVEFEPPTKQILVDEKGEYHQAQTQGWIKLSIAFRNQLSKLKGAKLAVFICICLHVNENGSAWPGVRKICEETGYDSEAVSKAKNDLEEMGILEITKRPGTTNLYRPAFAAYGKNSPSTPENPGTPEKRNTPPRKIRVPVPLKSETEVEPYKQNHEEELGAAKKRRTREIDPSQKELTQYFSDITHLPVPDPKSNKDWAAAQELWFKPIARIYGLANGRGRDLVRQSVDKMRTDKLTISSVKSIENVALSIFGENFRRYSPAHSQEDLDPMAALNAYLSEKEK